MEDLSIEAMKGYVVYELKTLGPCLYSHFNKTITEEDNDLLMAALRELQANDEIFRKGSIFYLPKERRENEG